MINLNFDLVALVSNPTLANLFNAHHRAAQVAVPGLFGWDETYNSVMVETCAKDENGQELDESGLWDASVVVNSEARTIEVSGADGPCGGKTHFTVSFNARGEMVANPDNFPATLYLTGVYVEPMTQASTDDIKSAFGLAVYED